MSYSKVIPVGSAGSITISEAGGNAKLVVSLMEASGGSFPGVAKGTLSAEVDISGAVLIDAALSLLAAKYPSASALISGLESIINAEIVNI